MSSLTAIAINKADQTATTLGDWAGQVLLVVNVASKCGLTPQYEALQKLHERYAAQGFSVVGMPANDFKESNLNIPLLALITVERCQAAT